METQQRIWAEIDLDALHHNIEQFCLKLKPGTKIIAVIKADGYGHGAVPLAHELETYETVWAYAVATFEEAMELRTAGMKKPILILGYTFPDCYEALAKEEIRPFVFRRDSLGELSAASIAAGKQLRIHIKVDTGLGRIGIRPDDEGLAFVKEAMATPGITIEGLSTHLARADDADKGSAYGQVRQFSDFYQRIERELGLHIPIRSCANSAAMLEMPDVHFEAVRAGIVLYGLWPSDAVKRNRFPLKPLLSLRSRIVYLKTLPAGCPISYGGTYVTTRPTRVATICAGYGDGYPRGLSGRGQVLIRGQRAPILGRVCMDQFMVDVTHIPEAREGDVVTLIGEDGGEQITMEDLCAMGDRFNYEVASCITPRVPRVYFKRPCQEVFGTTTLY